MKASVITILNNEKSVQAASRCIRSASKYGLNVDYFKAFTPEDSPIKIASDEGIPCERFDEVYSRFDKCLSAFLSHYWTWKACVEDQQPRIVFEHDAVVVSDIPSIINGDIVNLGKPSYGKFKTPTVLGIGPLVSKRYFPGAHAYYITPRGAKQLIDKAKTKAAPTDIFINLDNFSDLKEYYPWCAEAKDNFSTIQNTRGCVAKHNYGETYEII